MNKSKDLINKVYAFFNAIRGNNHPDDYERVLAVLKKTKELSKGSSDIEESFEMMRRASQYFGLDNLFPDKDEFKEIYATVDFLEETSWLEILQYCNTKYKYLVPEALIDKMEKNIRTKASNFLITEAEKFAAGLESVIENHPSAHFTLTALNNFYYQVLQEMYKDNNKVDVVQTSIYEYEFSSKKFDAILSAPIFSVRDRAEDTNNFICREYDMIAMENLALHLSSGGTLTIILPGKITYANGRIKQLRDFIQSMYCIKEIAELPTGVFESTGIRTFLFTISTGRTDEVIIKRYVADSDNPRREGINRLILDNDTFVLSEELTDMGDWNIDRIFESQDEDWIKFYESNVKKQELGSVATIFRGKAISKKTPTGNIGVINISNIGEYEVDFSSLDYIKAEERKLTNYILKDGDLLIPARGTVIRVAVFKEQSYPCIASSNVIVIRANDERLSTTFLKIFFDSQIGRKMLITRQQGVTVMNISYKELNSIEIPLPSVEEQTSIANEYEKEYEVYKKAIETAENRWASVVSSLQGKI